ncbi:Copper transporter 6 [Linum perenne]
MDMGSMDDGSMMTMHNSFFWGKDVILLFAGWPNHSLPMYILACLVIFFMAAVAEILSLAQSVMGAAVGACFYAVKMGLSYMVMLAVMSFNLGIFISAVLGHSVGLFVVKVSAFMMMNYDV